RTIEYGNRGRHDLGPGPSRRPRGHAKIVLDRRSLERLRYALDDLRPITTSSLAEQPHRRIPGRILPIKQPAPVDGLWQQDPNRLAHRTCHVRYRRIDADHQIQLANDRGGIAKVI